MIHYVWLLIVLYPCPHGRLTQARQLVSGCAACCTLTYCETSAMGQQRVGRGSTADALFTFPAQTEARQTDWFVNGKKQFQVNS